MAKSTKAKSPKTKKSKAKTTTAKAKSKATKPTKKSTKKSTAKKPSRPAAKVKVAKTEELEKLDETGRRVEQKPVANERRKNHRRRQIDPTTCEREYKEAEIEFMHALDEYKRASGRMFPTCSEILEVLMKMGYRKVAEPQELYNPEAQAASNPTDDENVVIEDTDLEPVE